MTNRSRRILLTTAAAVTSCGLLFGAAGCGVFGGSSTPSAAAATPTIEPTKPPQPSEQCGDPAVPAEVSWLATSSGDKLQTAAIRNGSDVVIFVHESGSEGLCGFWPYATWLADNRNVTSLLVDMCGYGASRCADGKRDDASWVEAVTSLVQRARSRGAGHVSLVGASFGGTVVLNAATAAGSDVDAVVDLSGEMSHGGLDAASSAKVMYVPTLYAVAPSDSLVRVADMRDLLKRTPSSEKKLVVTPKGAGHGWNMLSAPDGSGPSELAGTVADWVTSSGGG